MNVLKKAFFFLDFRIKKKLIGLIFLSIFNSLLEVLGIFLLVFIVKLLNSVQLDPNSYQIDESLIRKILIFIFNDINQINVIYFAFIGLIFVFVIKTISFIYFFYQQGRVLAELRVSLSNKLLKKYLSNNYLFHLNNNSATLINNFNEVSFFLRVINSLIILVSELILAAFIIIFLFYKAFFVTLVSAFYLIIFLTIFNKINIRASKKWGKIRQLFSQKMLKHLNQALGGIKELLILGRASRYLKEYNHYNQIYSSYEHKITISANIPKLYFELIVLMGVSIIIFFLLAYQKNIQFSVYFPIISLFILSVFRLIPSTARIINSIESIKYNKSAVDKIFFDIKNNNHTLISDRKYKLNINFDKNIILENVSFSYLKKKNYIFKNLNLKIRSGDFIGILGRSGSGKTTLVDLITGLIKPSSGRILVDGIDLNSRSVDLKKWQDLIGYVPQQIYLNDDTIKRNVAFGLLDKDIEVELVNKAIKLAGLQNFIYKLPKGIDAKVGELGKKISGGQKQRIGIARCLYKSPKLIIFDEATSALDEYNENLILNQITSFKGKITIIMITHKPILLKKCDRIFKLDESGSLKF
jgi:ABC-type multidrug transport system fused ATPase/permease subunit